jgi:hypothetical protein
MDCSTRSPAEGRRADRRCLEVTCAASCRLLERGHAPYIETVPFRVIFAFTLLQLVGLGAVYGITKAGVSPKHLCMQQCCLSGVSLASSAMPAMHEQQLVCWNRLHL